MNETISALAEAAQRGEIHAFEQLVQAYMEKAYYFTLGLVGNREDALDISQNAFAKAFRGIRSLASGGSFPAWFFSILRHEAANYLKKSGRRKFEGLEDNREIYVLPADPGAADPERMELCRIVQEAVDGLPLELREIIILQHFQGMDYSEIAALLGIPRGSVASRLYRARAALRKRLDGKI